MNRLSRHQREKIKSFVSFTSADEATALHYLNQSNWALEVACDRFFARPAPSATMSPAESASVDILFRKYANGYDPDLPDRIGPNGICQLLNDLGVDPASRSVLILAWKLSAQVQCEFSKEEWTKGLASLRCDSLDKLRAFMKRSDSEIQNKESFRNFYAFAFGYAKPLASRGLSLETATAYWRIIFGHNDRVEHWIGYLEKQNKGVTRDEWNLFLDFLNTTKPDLSDYDSEGAWPVRIDEYVDYCREQMKGEKMES